MHEEIQRTLQAEDTRLKQASCVKGTVLQRPWHDAVAKVTHVGRHLLLHVEISSHATAMDGSTSMTHMAMAASLSAEGRTGAIGRRSGKLRS
jgi:hypothetical protein